MKMTTVNSYLNFNLCVTIWLVLLMVFTLWCIYNLYKNYKLPNIIKFQNIQPNPTNQTIISYLDDLKANNKITNISGCENIYDDNVRVRELGYNSCGNANADYLNNNLDPNQKYGSSKSLSEVCPVSTKSSKYMNCMMKLITKFDTNTNILENINGEMNNIINSRLINRSGVLNNIGIDMNAYLNSDIQREFNNMQLLRDNNLNATLDEQLKNANTFYSDRAGISVNVFNDVPKIIPSNSIQVQKSIEEFEINLTVIDVDPYIQDVFLGDFKAVPGQYLAFNNLLVTLDYEFQTNNTINTPLPNLGNPAFPLSISSKVTHKSIPSSNKIKRIFLKIIDLNNDANVMYSVSNINTVEGKQNIIQLTLFDEKITTNTPGDSKTMFQLLQLLGINKSNRIRIEAEEFTSTEKKIHKIYKIMDYYNNTIMIMHKVR
jgi:hypothetical protein